jgi:hypothetical protein
MADYLCKQPFSRARLMYLSLGEEFDKESYREVTFPDKQHIVRVATQDWSDGVIYASDHIILYIFLMSVSK